MNLAAGRGRIVVAAMAASLVAMALSAWLLWPPAPAIPGAERVRQYSDVRACLLTGASGVTDPVAAAAWAGIQSASRSTKAMASYLPVPAGGSGPYLASLVQRQCSVIVAVGQAQVAAAVSQAARYRQVHFIVITQGPAAQAGRSASSVVRIPSAPATQLPQAVQSAVSAAVDS